MVLLLFITRVVQPFRVLARLAERISLGEWIPPIALKGSQEARELTRSFNVMQERLAQHVESRTRMLAALSHDLNTPLIDLRIAG